jgi:SOS-response transcriptional repressor LexA
MSWAIPHVAKLQAGETAQFRPRGHSMTGKVNDGDLVTVEPVDPTKLKVGDIVLCKVRGTYYLHLIKAIDGDRFQIGNNRGRINGWTKAVFGKVTEVSA